MADDVLDVEALLAPIGDDGAGVDLRLDESPSSIYQKLRDARSEARADERDRDSEDEPSGGVPEGWRQVRRLAVQALETGGKDFEIASWLTEALVRLEGLAGLAAGARLLTGMLDQHWETGFPKPDAEGLTDRAVYVGGLSGGDRDGTAMQPLRRTPLFRRPSGEPFSLFQYEASHQTAGLADAERREQRYQQGVVPFDRIEAEASFGPSRAALAATAVAATAARADWQALQDGVDARFGADAPPMRRVAEILERMAEVARQLSGEAAAAPGSFEGEAATAPSTGTMPAIGGFTAPSLANREQALRTLEQLAEFFQKSEPHSFLAYTLADAARRGRMTLPELLSEVMADDGARTAMLTALGIRPNAMDATE